MQMKCLFRSFDTSVRLIWVLSFPHVYSSTVLLLLNLPLLAWLMTTEACALVFWPPSESNSLIPFYKHDKSPLNERWKIPPAFLFIISRGESRKTFFLNQYLLLMLSSPKIIDSWSFVQPLKKVKSNLKVTTIEWVLKAEGKQEKQG